MLDDARIQQAVEGLVGFDWEVADLDEVALVAGRLGWDELEVDEVMASGGDPGDDGWLAAGLDDDDTVFELLVLLHLWDLEETEVDTAVAELTEAFDHALALVSQTLGVPAHAEVREASASGVTFSGRIAHWRAGDGMISLYGGVRDDQFGPELALFAQGVDDDDAWPGLEFLGES